jgi:hypothetical protein
MTREACALWSLKHFGKVELADERLKKGSWAWGR